MTEFGIYLLSIRSDLERIAIEEYESIAHWQHFFSWRAIEFSGTIVELAIKRFPHLPIDEGQEDSWPISFNFDTNWCLLRNPVVFEKSNGFPVTPSNVGRMLQWIDVWVCADETLKAEVVEDLPHVASIDAARDVLSRPADSKTDSKEKKSSKKKISSAAAACGKYVKNELKADPTMTRKSAVKAFVELHIDKGYSFNTLYRTLSDHPHLWKDESGTADH